MRGLSKEIFLIIIIFSVQSLHVFASDTKGAGFTVSSVLNNQQRQVSSPYFDLHLSPGESSEAIIEVKNTSDQEGVFNISVNTASTSSSMTPIFEQETKMHLTVPEDLYLSKITEVTNKSVLIPAQTTKRISFIIRMPNVEFDGKLYGGITVTRELSDQTPQKNRITNQFSYTNAIVISQNDATVPPHVIIGKMVMINNAGLLNISVPITLTTATLLTELSVQTMVINSSDQTVQKIKQDSRGIAPQSQFDYLIGLDNRRFKPGKYDVILQLTDKKGRKWESKQNIIIEKSQIQAVSKQRKNQPHRVVFNVWYVVIVLLFIIMVLMMWLIYVINRRKN